MKKFFSKGVKLVLGQRTGFSECLTLIDIWRQWEKRSTSDSLLSLSDSLLQSCERLSGDGSKKKKKKQQERWKQRKQGYTVIYFVKSRLPHNTKGEGGAEEKFAERTAWGKRRSKGKEKGEWTKSASKNESKLDVVKSDVPWTTQTLKK